ncbi:MAG TPA: hypothetical protein VME92_15290 [Acetobacteraceae bacterium]|nr:hypothetical protein [Acetobacteraceae bacterium]
MRTAIILAAIGTASVSALTASGALAADAVRSGHAEFDAYVTERIVSTVDGGVAKAMILDADGFDRVVKGKAPFDLLTFRCVSHARLAGDQFDDAGSCAKTDKDGDRIFYTWDSNGWAFTGGTGKFKGLTGKGVFTTSYYHDSGARGFELIAHHVGDWQIR